MKIKFAVRYEWSGITSKLCCHIDMYLPDPIPEELYQSQKIFLNNTFDIDSRSGLRIEAGMRVMTLTLSYDYCDYSSLEPIDEIIEENEKKVDKIIAETVRNLKLTRRVNLKMKELRNKEFIYNI